jgi:ferredoxin, 2Fe-2S
MIVVDQQGAKLELEPQPGKALMLQLRPLKVGVIGLCNGNAACGTCHVYVEPADEETLASLPEIDEYEEEVLAELASRRENSRLSCQLVGGPAVADLTLTVAPR